MEAGSPASTHPAEVQSGGCGLLLLRATFPTGAEEQADPWGQRPACGPWVGSGQPCLACHGWCWRGLGFRVWWVSDQGRSLPQEVGHPPPSCRCSQRPRSSAGAAVLPTRSPAPTGGSDRGCGTPGCPVIPWTLTSFISAQRKAHVLQAPWLVPGAPGRQASPTQPPPGCCRRSPPGHPSLLPSRLSSCVSRTAHQQLRCASWPMWMGPEVTWTPGQWVLALSAPVSLKTSNGASQLSHLSPALSHLSPALPHAGPCRVRLQTVASPGNDSDGPGSAVLTHHSLYICYLGPISSFPFLSSRLPEYWRFIGSHLSTF